MSTPRRSRVLWAAAAVALAVAFAVCFAFPGVAQAVDSVVVYDSIPSPIPGNVPSQAFQATQTTEFGDHVQFAAGTGRQLKSVTVLMSSWACQTGSGTTCTTTPGSTFSHPIALNIYAVNPGSPPFPGALLAT